MAISLTQSSDGKWIDEGTVALKLPPNNLSDQENPLVLVAGTCIAFVGPNGAGKSRMASWIDRNNKDVLYIRARRNIVMPDNYSISPEEKEMNSIFAGQSLNIENSDQARQFRYQKINGDAYADNDFGHVLNLLGSRHATAALKFKDGYDARQPPKHAPKSELDAAIAIWGEVLPHLGIDASKAPTLLVYMKSDPGKTYKPREMSDGEKAVFYLVSKCLIAPPSSIIIVDEPEMYVHRSIRNRLWDRIESSRKDCTFAYFTHDLNFVRSRKYQRVISIQSYQKSPKESWEYQKFISSPEADESLQISVWGSRQPTVLIEGERESIDFKVLSIAYPDVAIEPSGSCSQVISSTAALRQKKKMHHQDVYGIIDSDFRTEEEIKSLHRRGVFCLAYREIENVLCCEGVLRSFMRHFGFNSSKIDIHIENISELLLKKLKSKKETFVTNLGRRAITNLFEKRVTNSSNLGETSGYMISDEEALEIVAAERTAVNNVIEAGSLDGYLRYLSIRKDNCGSVISDTLGLKDYISYSTTILQLATDPDFGTNVLRAIRKALPRLPQ